MAELPLYVRIAADTARYVSGLAGASSATRRFSAGVRHEFEQVKAAAGGLHGQLAMLGAGVSAAAVLSEAAKLEKEMDQLQVSTGASRREMEGWRSDMLTNQKATGTTVQSQQELSGALQAAGLNMEKIRGVLQPASEAMAVAKTNGTALGKAMGVLSEQFKFDLSNPEAVRDLLDQMVVAGRLGNAELENLPDVFARVGSRVKASNMSFTESLALIESLSKVEPQADRLGTLVDSTLRVFDNPAYMKDAAKATGIKFFNADGSRREALTVLEDIKQKYDTMRTDKDRFKFISDAFGKADMDTIKGMRQLLDSNQLADLNKYHQQIQNAGGTVKHDLDTAISNAVDQTGRLKAALRDAAENHFARPLNDALSKAIGYAMDDKAKGGMEMSGEEMLGAGAAAVAGGYALTRVAGGLLARFGSTAAGVAKGKALEEATGVQSVFVVNMPGGGMAGPAANAATSAAAATAASLASKMKTGFAMAAGLNLKDFLKLGPAAAGTTAAGVTVAGAAGYGVGTLLNDGITALLTATNNGKERSLGTWLYDLTHDEPDFFAPTPRPAGVPPAAANPKPPAPVVAASKPPVPVVTAPKPPVPVVANPKPPVPVTATRPITPPVPAAKPVQAVSGPRPAASPAPAPRPATPAKAAPIDKQQANQHDVSASMQRVLNLFSAQDSQRMAALTQKLASTDIGGTLNIQVTAAPQQTAVAVQAKPNHPGLKYNVGRTMEGTR